MIITLAQAKKHLNIDQEFTDDDEYIEELIEVCENVIEKDLHATLAEITLAEATIPALLKHACKILLSTYFENREAVTVGATITETPLSYKHLISKYKNYTVG